MKYGLIIWDFNGTIIDDVQLGIDAVNAMLKKRSLPCISSIEEYRNKIRFPIKEYYKDLGFDYSKEKYESLALEWFKIYYNSFARLKAVTGAPELIRNIHNAGIPQIILSASENEILVKQLKFIGIVDCFDEIIGSDNIYARGKLDAANTVSKKYSGKILMIGDMTHDKAAADIIGADCILYTGGHGSKTSLESCGAKTVDSINEVKNFIF